MIGFRSGILSLRGRPIARVTPIDDKPETAMTVENTMRRAVKLHNAKMPRPAPFYFRPDTPPEVRFQHGGFAAVILVLLAAGFWSGSLAGFAAFALLAFVVLYLQPAR